MKALDLLNELSSQRSVKVKQLQVLCGYLNFLCRAIFPGRAFLHCMYAKYSSASSCGKLHRKLSQMGDGKSEVKLKLHHHIKMDEEFRFDCSVWHEFLNEDSMSMVCHPMIDLSRVVAAEMVGFLSDTSAKETLGFGCVLGNNWTMAQWEPGFIAQYKLSIEYLELLALVAGVLTWEDKLKNIRMIASCDNQAVVAMVNNMASKCQHCMKLIRISVGFKENCQLV